MDQLNIKLDMYMVDVCDTDLVKYFPDDMMVEEFCSIPLYLICLLSMSCDTIDSIRIQQLYKKLQIFNVPVIKDCKELICTYNDMGEIECSLKDQCIGKLSSVANIFTDDIELDISSIEIFICSTETNQTIRMLELIAYNSTVFKKMNDIYYKSPECYDRDMKELYSSVTIIEKT
jgi:hypothetical protein